MMKEFEFNLKDCELTYSDNGVAAKSTKLVLKAPTPRQAKQADKLRQYFMRALGGMNRNNTESNAETPKGDKKIEGKEVILLLSMSTTVDMFEVRECFAALLLSGSGLLDGIRPITKFNLENEFNYEEQTQVMGEYIANFLTSSLQIGS